MTGTDRLAWFMLLRWRARQLRIGDWSLVRRAGN